MSIDVGGDPAITVTGNSGTKAAGASAQLVPLNLQRRGLQVTVDPGASSSIVVYFLLGAGTCSSTNFHFGLSAGGSWDGNVGFGMLWDGAVQFYSSGTPNVGVVEVI